jgi:hypothetical protein
VNPTPAPKSYLAVCAIYRDEAPYLAEWVEFHRLVGVERFFLYDNGSVDDHRASLAPYLEEGVVTLHSWPRYPGQLQAYEHCAFHYRDDARWVAFLDLDEFLFAPAAAPVPDVLREYEDFAAVAVNWAVFGNSGHETKPDGLVTESYLWRVHDDGEPNRLVKTIADPRHITRCRNPHYFFYEEGRYAVDERRRPVPFARSESPSFERLRINHYFTRSDEEFLRKLRKGKADQLVGRPHGIAHYREMGPERNQVRDEAILAYLPRLRKALAAR